MFSFENLLVYQKARILVKEVYKVQRRFPADERYALGDQIRRSITSVTSNIAEGSGRESFKEKIHFLRISSGSMSELETQLTLCLKLGYISQEECNATSEKLVSVWKQLNALISVIKKRINSQESVPF